MKGKYTITVENKRIHYEFEIKRNITILKGNSATGKTTLVELIEENFENGTSTGVFVKCEKDCVVLSGRRWEHQLKDIKDSIVFIDEWNPFLTSKDFAAAIQNTDNYYVIVTRLSLSTLPYSVDEVYGIRERGKYRGLKKTYNEMYRIYGNHNYDENIVPDRVITEDSNSGFEFFNHICEMSSIRCKSAFGKSKIKDMIEDSDEKVLIIADGAAFGSEIEKIYESIYYSDNIYLYLPESFEWLILKSGIVKTNLVKIVLERPYDFVDSAKYFSWERYFTDLLVQNTTDDYLHYSKRKLNKVYLQEEIISKILEVMDNIKLLSNQS